MQLTFKIINKLSEFQNSYNQPKWEVWVTGPRSISGDVWGEFNTRKEARQYVEKCKENLSCN